MPMPVKEIATRVRTRLHVVIIQLGNCPIVHTRFGIILLGLHGLYIVILAGELSPEAIVEIAMTVATIYERLKDR
jgi:hypothetical protein